MSSIIFFENPVKKNLGNAEIPKQIRCWYMLHAHRTFSTEKTTTSKIVDQSALIIFLNAFHGGLVEFCYLAGRSAPVPTNC